MGDTTINMAVNDNSVPGLALGGVVLTMSLIERLEEMGLLSSDDARAVYARAIEILQGMTEGDDAALVAVTMLRAFGGEAPLGSE